MILYQRILKLLAVYDAPCNSRPCDIAQLLCGLAGAAPGRDWSTTRSFFALLSATSAYPFPRAARSSLLLWSPPCGPRIQRSGRPSSKFGTASPRCGREACGLAVHRHRAACRRPWRTVRLEARRLGPLLRLLAAQNRQPGGSGHQQHAGATGGRHGGSMSRRKTNELDTTFTRK